MVCNSNSSIQEADARELLCLLGLPDNNSSNNKAKVKFKVVLEYRFFIGLGHLNFCMYFVCVIVHKVCVCVCVNEYIYMCRRFRVNGCLLNHCSDSVSC